MNFSEVHRQLWLQKRIVTYKSLTSSKTHKVQCTINTRFQSTSDKIVVWDIKNNKSIDIEVNTIKNIK